MASPIFACMALVASLNQLPPRVLASIASVEGGRVGQASHNLDGSEDLGPMQVNTRWLPAIARAINGTPQQARVRLVNDACFNVSAGGAILRTYLQETHGDLLQAIGDYHSHTVPLNQRYQVQVIDAARRLFAAPPPHPAATPVHRISFTPVR